MYSETETNPNPNPTQHTMKTTFYGRPSYSYNRNGVTFTVCSVGPTEWYINFDDIYFVSEEEHARSYRTKRDAINSAHSFINRK